MKIPILVLALLQLALGANAAPLKVVASVPDLGDIAQRIGGKNVEVSTLASGMEDPHNVLMKPSMISRLQQADLFIVQGLDLEHAYAPPLLAESRNQKIQPGKPGYLDCSKGISVRDVPNSIDRSQGEQHPGGNPHYNLDPVRMKTAANAIADRMAELDPANAATYKANAKAFGAQVDAKMAGWKAKLGGKRIKFVSYHPDMVYFAERFGLNHVGTIQPKPGVEPGPRYVDELIARMKQEQVTIILKESYFSDRLPGQIAKATGARVVSVPIMVNGTRAASDYFALIDTLVNAVAGN